MFLATYFPLSKIVKLRNDITYFQNFDGEYFYKAWECFKKLLRKCPHHYLLTLLQLQPFYNELMGQPRTIKDFVAWGALMSKTQEEVFALLDEIASNKCQQPLDRIYLKKVVGIVDVDTLTTFQAQTNAFLLGLSKKLDTRPIG